MPMKMTPAETERLFATAAGHHQAGRLREAEALYRRVLAANPNHIMSLQFLGVLTHQVGQNDNAIELINKAIALDGRNPDCHYNIGAVFQVLGRLDEAVTHYSRAIAIKADFAEAHYELANVLARQEKFGEAAAQYQRALTLNPNYVDALINLGGVLAEQGKRDEAVACWRRALALRPNHPVALMNIGLAVKQQGKLDEAVALLRQVLALKPDYADAHYNLGNVLQGLGQWDEARAAYRRALAYKPDLFKALEALVTLLLTEGNIAEALELARRALATNETRETKSAIVACLRSPLAHPGMGDLRDLLVRALSAPWIRPADLAPSCTRFLALNDAIGQGMARATQAWPNLLPAKELAGCAGLAPFAEEPLLRVLLESAPVCEVTLERFATGLRFILLEVATADADCAITEPVLSLYCAVARQCFINSYVFAQSDAEIERTRALRDAVVASLASGAAIPALSLLAVAAYFPLHTLPGAESLLNRSWPDAVTAVLEQQVRAPIDEQRSRASLPVLTAIDDDVSVQVRGQYEQNPYPQWVKIATAGKPETVDAFMRRKFPLSPFVELGNTGGVEILVAGCGTGQHPIETAGRFKAAQVLAVDLSLTSLCYAQRQTRARGLNNIRYAQADIMTLSSIGRTFDVIESSGVLHHLADPFAGWRVLLSMLRPGGVMLLGLYSEIARRDIVAAREFIAARGYRPTADDIRRCRQDLFKCPDGTPLHNVTKNQDFFSLSECRDLLFHVQEHRLTLPEIAAFITENNLQFLGFDIGPPIRRDYARRFPNDVAMTDLAQWHRYETENPDSFITMYQFWVQKK
jgi:tetratricopeptide (TPR) repeat protein/SAM-dependent methyltransferase